ncbi:hypothetical protein [Kineococcus sp. NPDC059986]|uniref:hypothetical protein n=1 Tax=Kineococcus sp. NPDC059986 TaxID=3155538 RepID=UPI00344C1D67
MNERKPVARIADTTSVAQARSSRHHIGEREGGGGALRYEIQPSGVVEWQNGDGSVYALLLLPVLWVINLLVWLIYRARGRGYTLHVFDEGDHRVARERYRTRPAAESALARRQAIDEARLRDLTS